MYPTCVPTNHLGSVTESICKIDGPPKRIEALTCLNFAVLDFNVDVCLFVLRDFVACFMIYGIEMIF